MKKLSNAVLEMDEELTVLLAKEVIDNGVDVLEAIEKGFSKGMYEAGRMFEEEDYFVPELLMCSDAMNARMDILKPYLKAKEQSNKYKGCSWCYRRRCS